VAGVKAQAGGKRLEPAFSPKPCDSCNETILKLVDAYHVRVIDMSRNRTVWAWKHRKCLNLNTK
jgi:hypothetical protein